MIYNYIFIIIVNTIVVVYIVTDTRSRISFTERI